MGYYIRIHPSFESVEAGTRAYFLKDTQLRGAPPAEALRGLSWRCLQSREMVLNPVADRVKHSEFYLRTFHHMRQENMEVYDTTSPRQPFGQAQLEHLDCADWIWDASSSRWWGQALHHQEPFTAPLFAFWLEQSLRWACLKSKLAVSYSDPRILPKMHPAPGEGLYIGSPLLQPFHFEDFGELEKKILSYACSFFFKNDSPLKRPDSLHPVFDQRFAAIAQKYGIGAFEALFNLEPSCMAQLEQLHLTAALPVISRSSSIMRL